MKKSIKPQEYIDKFAELYNTGNPIMNETTGEIFVAADDEEFRQCYAETPARRMLPMYWFLSNKENLLSLKKDRIQWLNKNPRQGRDTVCYKFKLATTDGKKTKNIEAHDLMGLVWESDSFGLATDLLNEKGVKAFGIHSKTETAVQGHHRDTNETNNNPDNILFVSNQVHPLLHNAPKHDASPEKEIKYMQELGEVMTKENLHKLTIVFTGEVYDQRTGTWSNDGCVDVFSTDKINLSYTAVKQLQELAQTSAFNGMEI